MLNPRRISPLILISAVGFLVIGELLAGTSLYYVTMMAIAMICIGTTYNILSGASTIGGLFFSAYALGTLVISQFAKVLLLEGADKNLEAPQLTITVYMVFYLCVMIGCFLFGWIRIQLPKPLEPETQSHLDMTYVIALCLGAFATFAFTVNSVSGGGQTAARSFGLGFQNMLLFAIVLAVEKRLRDTGGLHSFGIKVFIPMAVIMVFGFLDTSRSPIIIPSIVYITACYVKGYQFKRKHYLAAVLGIVAISTVISPVEIYLRQFRDAPSFSERNYAIIHGLFTIPNWTSVTSASEEANVMDEGRGQYYNRAGTFILGRVSMIRSDSNLISACSSGYHYGFEALKIDLLMQVPHFIYNSKPEASSAAFLGRVAGIGSDEQNLYPSYSAISDSYGAYGWWGVALEAMVGFPLLFIIYESIFDMSRPWGTVALGLLCSRGWGMSLGGLAGMSIRTPIEILLLSYLIGIVVRMIPSKGDR